MTRKIIDYKIRKYYTTGKIDERSYVDKVQKYRQFKEEFTDSISKSIKDGRELYGSIISHGDSIYQPMVKYEDLDNNKQDD